MNKPLVSSVPVRQFALWKKMRDNRSLISLVLEITSRCNLDCHHCYINLPAGDQAARDRELTLDEINDITDQAVSLGAIWCLITGGEPLLRPDFADIYLYMKKKGLLVSVFTNAVLITDEHIRLFRKYPPRDIEVSVYGVTEKTFGDVTHKPAAFQRFKHGLDLLLESGVEVRLKAMALRSTYHELPDIARFCREKTKDYFRFDPLLHLRFDGNDLRNREIAGERLSPAEVVEIERADPERLAALQNHCDRLINPHFAETTCTHLFHCGAGKTSVTVSSDGILRLCSSLWHPDCVYDLRKGTLQDAWRNFIPAVRDLRSHRKEFLENCQVCPLVNLCLWCPAHAHLETGELDAPVENFCMLAHARAEALGSLKHSDSDA